MILVNEYKRVKEIIMWWTERHTIFSLAVMFMGFLFAEFISTLVIDLPLIVIMVLKNYDYASIMNSLPWTFLGLFKSILFFPVGIRISSWGFKKALPWYLK